MSADMKIGQQTETESLTIERVGEARKDYNLLFTKSVRNSGHTTLITSYYLFLGR